MIWRRKYDRILIGRKQYRIEFNWNALCSSMEAEGMTFGQLSEFEIINPTRIISLFYEGILEGCRMENKRFPFSKEDFTAMLTPESIDQLSLIFQSQNKSPLKDLEKIAG